MIFNNKFYKINSYPNKFRNIKTIIIHFKKNLYNLKNWFKNKMMKYHYTKTWQYLYN